MKRAISIGACLSLLPSLALAQAPAPDGGRPANEALDAHPAGVHIIDDTEPKAPLVPRAHDLLGKHVLVGGSVGPVWSLGKLASDVAAVRALSTGLSVHADVGFGLSRSVVLGAWGSFASYGDGDACDSCSGKSFAVGPYVRYHLSQGFRFDPWILAGAGYRQVSYDDSLGTKQTFSGVEWLRLELGADYYVFSGFGVGPYGSLGLSSYAKRPEGAGEARVNTELGAGLRFLLDLPGR
jgi:hypothetical protein